MRKRDVEAALKGIKQALQRSGAVPGANYCSIYMTRRQARALEVIVEKFLGNRRVRVPDPEDQG